MQAGLRTSGLDPQVGWGWPILYPPKRMDQVWPESRPYKSTHLLLANSVFLETQCRKHCPRPVCTQDQLNQNPSVGRNQAGARVRVSESNMQPRLRTTALSGTCFVWRRKRRQACPPLTAVSDSNLAAADTRMIRADSPSSRFMALDKQQSLTLARCRPPSTN